MPGFFSNHKNAYLHKYRFCSTCLVFEMQTSGVLEAGFYMPHALPVTQLTA